MARRFLRRARRRPAFKRRGFRNSKRNMLRKRANPTSMISRGPTQVADRCYVKLTYVDMLSGTQAVAGQPFWYPYRGSDLFDPYAGIGGHQPMGFDQWMTFYQRFYVRGSKIEIRFTGSLDGAIMMVVPSQSNLVAITNIDQVIEQPNAKWIMSGPGKGPTMIKHYWTTKKAFASKFIGTQNTDYTGTAAASPAINWFWNIGFTCADINAVIDFQASVRITYYVEFYDRILQGES